MQRRPPPQRGACAPASWRKRAGGPPPKVCANDTLRFAQTPMPFLESRLQTAADTYQANRASMLSLLEQVRSHEARAVAASSASAERFAKRGQLLPRERLALL